MRFPSRLCVLLGLALAAAPFIASIAPGCGGNGLIDCPGQYDPDRLGADGMPDPCCVRTLPCPPPGAGKDAGKDAATDAAADADGGPPPTDAAADAAIDAATDSGPSCSGACVPLTPAAWAGPLLFAVGPAGAAPACPPGTMATLPGYHGRADLDAGPIVCGSCSCAPSEGACQPPQTITASSNPCASADGGVEFIFDPPPAWDGGCTSLHQLPPGNCPSCPQSVVVDPLTLTTGVCAPLTGDAGPPPPPTFATDVAACEAATSLTCGDLVHVCATAAASPFKQCVFADGEHPCVAPWSEQTLVATGDNDGRTCAPCQCGAVQGASCTGSLAIFNDTVCGVMPPPQAPTLAQALVGLGSVKVSCVDVQPAGAALGSKALLNVKYAAGSCAPSGGEPTDGGVVATGVATFCCLP